MTLTTTVHAWRTNLRERYLWLLLPAFFWLAFILDSRGAVANVFRIAVFIPVLFVIRPVDLRAIWGSDAARWFVLLMAWLSLTLLWDGASEEDWKILQRGLQALTLMVLVFLSCHFQAQREPAILTHFILAGLAGAVLIALAWPGTPAMLSEQFPGIDRRLFYTRGILSISIYVGWMMAILFIAAFFMALSARGVASWFYYLAASAFALLMVMAQSRAACLVMIVGFVMAIAMQKPRWLLWWLAGSALAVVLAVLLSDQLYQIVLDSLERGNSYRFAIWQNGLGQLLHSPLNGLVGFGLSASTTNLSAATMQDHYHSIYLNTVWYGGVVALGLYLACLWQVFRRLLAKPQGKLWLCLLVPMQLGFVVDGEHFFVTPSAMMLSYLLPLFWAMFGCDPLRSKREPLREPGLQMDSGAVTGDNGALF
ncbi:MAG: hypothetical protein VR73_02925 [Gammaproteobacteria bacterium BRH_c0]|nr:MAG: hypothetical protein VR73_02925 [Gammaproteobacteria bacterium BRH_c0]